MALKENILFFTAACCPRRDFYTHTLPLPPRNCNRLLYSILKKTCHLYCILKKSTQKDFCTAYSKRTSFVLRTQNSTQKIGKKKQQKKTAKKLAKNMPKKYIAIFTTHMANHQKKQFLKHNLEPVLLLS